MRSSAVKIHCHSTVSFVKVLGQEVGTSSQSWYRSAPIFLSSKLFPMISMCFSILRPFHRRLSTLGDFHTIPRRHVWRRFHTAFVREKVTECEHQVRDHGRFQGCATDSSVQENHMRHFEGQYLSRCVHAGVLLGGPLLGRPINNSGPLLNFHFRTAP